MPYTVSTPVFEGPFDLLLHLITREQVDLWEVSLSAIVDAYVASLEAMRSSLDLETATEFLLIAAVLLELKARRLLPGREGVELDEELALWEERDLLLARLLECKTFKDAASALSRLMSQAALSWPRAAGLEEAFVSLVPDVLAGVTPEQLRDVMRGIDAARPPEKVALDHVAPIRISVAEVVEELIAELAGLGSATFRQLTDRCRERADVIVRFLALLEMCKRGVVDLRQDHGFADLQVTWVGGDDSEFSAVGVDEYGR
ncbi:MAG: segregation/condensation protein A [Acidimicrobiaceae bacterium]|nr:segregation/condensation protein A [Acidimicrobiaceae bacterium]